MLFLSGSRKKNTSLRFSLTLRRHLVAFGTKENRSNPFPLTISSVDSSFFFFFPQLVGVPQGTVLYPLLYSLFTSNIPWHHYLLLLFLSIPDSANLFSNKNWTIASELPRPKTLISKNSDSENGVLQWNILQNLKTRKWYNQLSWTTEFHST